MTNIVVKRGVPIFVLMLIGYATFVYVDLCVRETRTKLEKVLLLIPYCTILFMLLTNWAFILIRGPGVIRKRIAPYKLITYLNADGKEIDDSKIKELGNNEFSATSEVPDYFYCDFQGYPYYCKACESIKPMRTKHSSEFRKCVAKMDHFCVWVGTVIGKQNYKAFVNFVLCFTLYLVLILVVLIVYMVRQINRRKHTTEKGFYGYAVDPNLVVALFFCTWFTLMVPGLLYSHLMIVLNNETTFEVRRRGRLMHSKEKTKNGPHCECGYERTLRASDNVHVNVLYNSKRYVLDLNDPTYRPFKKSYIENLKEVFGNKWWFTWWIPSGYSDADLVKETFSEEFLQLLYDRIDRGEAQEFNTVIVVE